MFDFLKNKLLYQNKYKTHSEAVIVSCYFNPQKSPYRLKAFKIFYESIKHLNHHIIECVIGDGQPELHDIVPSDNRQTVRTKNLLWHKEALLNRAIYRLPEKYKYIFWIDADVVFTNKNWLIESVDIFKNGLGSKKQPINILQPFEYCVHLDKDQLEPEFDLAFAKAMYNPYGSIVQRSKRLWRSFSANYVTNKVNAKSENYDVHGHVGFAWGATRELLNSIPLYDKALIGGADHIIAHAAAGQIGHSCIAKSFSEDIDEVNKWSRDFSYFAQGKIGYVQGDLYHIWHGEIEKRQYLKRIVDFTSKAKNIVQKDENGLYVTDDKNTLNYMSRYFLTREVMHEVDLLDPSNPLNYVNPASPLYQAINAVQDDSQNNVVQNITQEESHHEHNDNVHQNDSTVNYNENFS